ncbi:fdxN element excision controlling factor protein [Leptolyngbya sp. NIES-3755]|nr:fdxN element excision controlling factor protein [Leptolyngbya sp. NIES-3755]
MDKLTQYQEIIQSLLSEYSDRRSNHEVDSQCIFDLQRNHFQVVNVGWSDRGRIYGCVLHLDIQNDKIWLQYNGTEIDIAQELVDRGVPKSDIVLGFQAPHRRPLTDYAVG